MNFSGSFGLLVAVATVLLHLVATAVVPESESKGGKETERIIGGRDAEEGQFPWAVALFYEGSFVCTASIISPTTVLTAAHCVVFNGVEQSPSRYHGIANVNKSSEVVRIEFNDLIVHPEYSGENINNDIAVFKTTAPIEFNNNVQPICIAGPDTPMNEYRNATAMGWGNTSRIRIFVTIPNILQYVAQRVVDNNICPLLGAPGVDENKICAKGFFTGVCNGDSGGPLVHLSADKPPVEIGVTSYINAIIGCGKLSPAVWTRVSKYYDFVMQSAGDGMVCTV